VYVICSSNKRRNNYLRLRCSVTICQRTDVPSAVCECAGWATPRRGSEVNVDGCYKWFRWVSPTCERLAKQI
ncbi:MAG: hypothetical protein ACTS4T_01845, partial [Candidatus Hodgkinia cicadicola]